MSLMKIVPIRSALPKSGMQRLREAAVTYGRESDQYKAILKEIVGVILSASEKVAVKPSSKFL